LSETEWSETWSDKVSRQKDEFVWEHEVDNPQEFPNPVKKFFVKKAAKNKNPKKYDKLLENAEYGKDFVTREEIMKLGAEYKNPTEDWTSLLLQNKFLGLCATYKLCLWLYCILYAIPRSGSSVLMALATDKRNDFICTYSAITVTFLASHFQSSWEFLEENEDKVDPFVSLVMALFIMYSWIQLMVEHAVLLSQEAGNEDYSAGIHEVISSTLKDLSLPQNMCHIADDEDIKIYLSSTKHTIEVTLSVQEVEAKFSQVSKVTTALQHRLLCQPDVEKVLILTKRG